jgi:hypothetical protein
MLLLSSSATAFSASRSFLSTLTATYTVPPSYRFNVQYNPDHEPVACSALGTTLSEELSSIPLTRCGEENSTVAFKWTLEQDGSATLLVKRDLQAMENATEEAVSSPCAGVLVVSYLLRGLGLLGPAVYP